jgi:hypothetical protein
MFAVLGKTTFAEKSLAGIEDAVVDFSLAVESYFHNLKPLTSAHRKPIDDDYGDVFEDERNP